MKRDTVKAKLDEADQKTRYSGPPLILRMPRVDGPRYKALKPDDPLYSMASWAYHHGNELPRKVRRGLYIALEAAWPGTQGDKSAEHRRLAAYTMHLNGDTIGDIAFAFKVQLATVQGWITEIKNEIKNEGDTSPRIEIADGDEPEDPASDLSYARSLKRSPTELKAYLDAERHHRSAPLLRGAFTRYP